MAEAAFRPMREGEASAVVALWQAAGLTRPWNPPGEDIAEIEAHPHADILVAVDVDELIAAIIVGYDGHRGWVYYLGVDPGRRGEGLGRQAMEAAEHWLRARGAQKIQLIVRKSNAPVIAFYEALGYEEGEVVLMQKWLNPMRERLYREAPDAH